MLFLQKQHASFTYVTTGCTRSDQTHKRRKSEPPCAASAVQVREESFCLLSSPGRPPSSDHKGLLVDYDPQNLTQVATFVPFPPELGLEIAHPSHSPWGYL